MKLYDTDSMSFVSSVKFWKLLPLLEQRMRSFFGRLLSFEGAGSPCSDLMSPLSFALPPIRGDPGCQQGETRHNILLHISQISHKSHKSHTNLTQISQISYKSHTNLIQSANQGRPGLPTFRGRQDTKFSNKYHITSAQLIQSSYQIIFLFIFGRNFSIQPKIILIVTKCTF